MNKLYRLTDNDDNDYYIITDEIDDVHRRFIDYNRYYINKDNTLLMKTLVLMNSNINTCLYNVNSDKDIILYNVFGYRKSKKCFMVDYTHYNECILAYDLNCFNSKSKINYNYSNNDSKEMFLNYNFGIIESIEQLYKFRYTEAIYLING